MAADALHDLGIDVKASLELNTLGDADRFECIHRGENDLVAVSSGIMAAARSTEWRLKRFFRNT